MGKAAKIYAMFRIIYLAKNVTDIRAEDCKYLVQAKWPNLIFLNLN